jgi:hypothetical protein
MKDNGERQREYNREEKTEGKNQKAKVQRGNKRRRDRV